MYYFIKSKGKNDTFGSIKINRKVSSLGLCQYLFLSGTTIQMKVPDLASRKSYSSVTVLGQKLLGNLLDGSQSRGQ